MSSQKNTLHGTHVLVTGASSGLGAHFAKTLAKQGARVSVAARRLEKLHDVVTAIKAEGGEAFAVSLDVTDQESIITAFNQAEGHFGSITVLVNNAGVALTKPALDVSNQDWSFVMDTNLKGAWFCAVEIAKRLKEKKNTGSIINIASILGERVAGAVGPYAVSKAAVIQMTKTLALEWARYGIRVNAIAPGYFETELNSDFFKTSAGAEIIKRIPQRRLGKPQELDGPLLLLSSDASSFMNGSIIVVDGGHLVSSL